MPREVDGARTNDRGPEPQGRRGPLRYLAAGSLVVVAVLSGMSAFAFSIGRLVPQSSLGLWPPNGIIYGKASNLRLGQAMIANGQQLPRNIPVDVVRLSRRALDLEPAESTAARNIGYSLAGRGETKRASELMEAAYKLSRRDAGLNLWLLEDRARRGDAAGALKLYDITIRTSTSAAGLLMGRMATMLNQPGAVPLFEQLLAGDPPWLEQFWTAVLSSDTDLAASYRLRLALHADGIKMARSHDALLIQRLADAGMPEQAFDLYRAIGGSRPAGGELLVDPDFRRPSEFPPIGWKMPVAGTFGASIDRKTGQLAIAALSGAKGTVLQQLVPIQSGSYELLVRYGANSLGAGKRMPFSVRLACAEGSEARLNRVLPVPSSGAQRFTLDTACRYAWVSLVLDGAESANGIDAAIDRISLKRLS